MFLAQEVPEDLGFEATNGTDLATETFSSCSSAALIPDSTFLVFFEAAGAPTRTVKINN